MAASATVTYDELGSIRKVMVDFTTDGSGDCSVTTKKITGELIKLVTDPGSAAPSANWDVVVTDEEGLNVLAGVQNSAALIARHTANTEQTYLQLLNADNTPIGISIFPVVCDKLTIAVANGGDSKTGQIILYVRCDPRERW